MRGPSAPSAGQLPGGLDAVHARHPDVHQHDIGAQLAADPHRLGPVARPCRRP